MAIPAKNLIWHLLVWPKMFVFPCYGWNVSGGFGLGGCMPILAGAFFLANFSGVESVWMQIHSCIFPTKMGVDRFVEVPTLFGG